MENKKISIMASYDWSLRYAFKHYVEFLDLSVTYRGKQYAIDLGRIIAEPLKCGENLNRTTNLIVDRTIHWNDYYKCWAQQALNCMMKVVNHSNTFNNYNKHSTYDLMARFILPEDYFPTTVLLPQFFPYTDEQHRDEEWHTEQDSIRKHTHYGWDPARCFVDMQKVRSEMADFHRHRAKSQIVRRHFYSAHNYLKEAMEHYFNNSYPVYLKKAFGGGGSDVYKINSLKELYQRYDQTGERVFHLQEAIENYDMFVRCLAVGPQVLPMRFEPDKPLHQHYSPDKLILDGALFSRLKHYVLFINSYHRWTYNSFEALVKGGVISPIDFANACPDSNFTSLHVHFPWLLNALVKWFSFCAVTDIDMRIDLEETRYLRILHDPALSRQEKFERVNAISREYFAIDKFQSFCRENFSGLEDKMIAFFDRHFNDVIRFAIAYSAFPEEEHAQKVREYQALMQDHFRANAKAYLKDPGL